MKAIADRNNLTAIKRRRRRGALGILARVVIGLVVAVVAVAAAYPLAIRPWHQRWGATNSEVSDALPGDELVSNPVAQSTRAITINAPASVIWPWLNQIGQGRGGFYSYSWMPNLLNSDIQNADRVAPEWQLKAGDTVWLASPKNLSEPPRYLVHQVIPERALVLLTPEGAPSGFRSSWAFILQPVGDGQTRLIIRSRGYSEPAWVAPVMGVEPMHFLMEQKMLRTLKDIAETQAR